MIQGGSLLSKDVPPYVKVRNTSTSFSGINSIGLRRRNYTNEEITEIQNIYRVLYQSGLNNTDAIEKIEAELPASKERDEIILFIKNSQRGIIKGYTSVTDRYRITSYNVCYTKLLRKHF